MASNYEKGFTIEYVNRGSKRITCRDCYYYDSSDKSCTKTPRVFPESGYDSYKYCKYFTLDNGTDYYDEKVKKVGTKPTSNTVKPVSKTTQNNVQKLPQVKVKASLNEPAKKDTANIITDEEFRKLELVISAEKLSHKTVYKILNIYLDNGKKKQIDVGVLEGKAYVRQNQYPQEYIDEVKRIHKKK